MAKLTMNSSVDAVPKEEAQPKKSREWKPSVRIKERKQTFRQKLNISDLYPDRNYIKEVDESEGRYFLLIIIPVVVTALYNAVSRQDLLNKLVDLLLKTFGH